MFTSALLAVVPHTPSWSPTIGLVMVICNIIAIAFARATMKYPNVGPEMPASNLFGGFSIPAVIASTSFGHLLGTGVILGLANLGVL
ncbi:MAG: photosystem I reaction center subunit PsaK [Elainellaceae cyanobacterium]